MRRVLALATAVVALSLTGSASAATAVRCGDVISGGTVVLDRDLACPAGDGLVVRPDQDVTLDLGGHAISGGGTGDGLRFVTAGAPGGDVVVRDGAIRGFEQGVAIGGILVHAIDLQDLNIRANGTGVSCFTGAHLTISDSVVAANAGHGFVNSRCQSKLIGDQLRANGWSGAVSSQDSLRVVRDSVFANNGSNGLAIDFSVASITGNRFTGNGGAGLTIFEAGCSWFPSYEIADNVADDNAHGGLALRTGMPCDATFVPAGAGNAAKHNGDFQCLVVVCAANRGLAAVDATADVGI
ncbi:MAG TPA: right-handed parallel beta-helix repeat-containing protein [Baekduia sp.]|nr:right-handed parallel beta-helix repeat-containing protein [Baekduia sp.]